MILAEKGSLKSQIGFQAAYFFIAIYHFLITE